MFSFENGPDIETVSNASEFLGDALNIWEHVILYQKYHGASVLFTASKEL
jgi:hypothetical protein